jgi:hypothetical protein
LPGKRPATTFTEELIDIATIQYPHSEKPIVVQYPRRKTNKIQYQSTSFFASFEKPRVKPYR